MIFLIWVISIRVLAYGFIDSMRFFCMACRFGLWVAKIEAGAFSLDTEPLSVQKVVDDAMLMVRTQAGQRHLRMVQRVQPSLAGMNLIGSPNRLRQVMGNLLANSVKFTESGSITLEAHLMDDGRNQTNNNNNNGNNNNDDVSAIMNLPLHGSHSGHSLNGLVNGDNNNGRIVSRSNLGGGGGGGSRYQSRHEVVQPPDDVTLVVSISDTGIGIHPSDLPKLFQHFSQLDQSGSRRAQGTGVGLAICKKLVECMGGTITVSSALGQGSRFTFSVRLKRLPSTTGGLLGHPLGVMEGLNGGSPMLQRARSMSRSRSRLPSVGTSALHQQQSSGLLIPQPNIITTPSISTPTLNVNAGLTIAISGSSPSHQTVVNNGGTNATTSMGSGPPSSGSSFFIGPTVNTSTAGGGGAGSGMIPASAEVSPLPSQRSTVQRQLIFSDSFLATTTRPATVTNAALTGNANGGGGGTTCASPRPPISVSRQRSHSVLSTNAVLTSTINTNTLNQPSETTTVTTSVPLLPLSPPTPFRDNLTTLAPVIGGGIESGRGPTGSFHTQGGRNGRHSFAGGLINHGSVLTMMMRNSSGPGSSGSGTNTPGGPLAPGTPPRTQPGSPMMLNNRFFATSNLAVNNDVSSSTTGFAPMTNNFTNLATIGNGPSDATTSIGVGMSHGDGSLSPHSILAVQHQHAQLLQQQQQGGSGVYAPITHHFTNASLGSGGSIGSLHSTPHLSGWSSPVLPTIMQPATLRASSSGTNLTGSTITMGTSGYGAGSVGTGTSVINNPNSVVVLSPRYLNTSNIATMSTNAQAGGVSPSRMLSPAQSVSPPQPGRILVVDDSAINVKLAVRMLRQFDKTLLVDTACDGKEGVAAFMNCDYDVIFMDLQMPIVDGLEATRAIRELERGAAGVPAAASHAMMPPVHERKRAVPIVALTASAMTEDRTMCLQAGMDDYLAKPFTADGLATLVKKWLPMHLLPL
jgi:CheY-like chemotaxis protein